MKSIFSNCRLKLLLALNFFNLSFATSPQIPDMSKIFGKNEESDKLRDEYHRSMAKQTTMFYRVTDWAGKAIVGTIIGTFVKDFIDIFKDAAAPRMLIKDLEKSSMVLLLPYGEIKLFLTETQRNFEDYLVDSLKDFIKSGKNKPTECIVVFGGESGTGKSASMFTIINTLLNLEMKKQVNVFTKLTKFVLPNFLQGLLKIRETKDGIYLVISGAYFYNYSNEQEKAAALFDNLLNNLADHIRNNPKKYFIVAIDEAEIITQEPFARILKIFTTQLSQLNKDKKNGYGLILMSTNYINACAETLARRLFVLEFDTPSADIKLKTFLLYLEKNMNKNNKKEYTETLVSYINKWIKFCENFSHSDMENIVWLLKLKYTTTNVIVTLEDVLKTIYIEWKKRNIIVNKAKKENIRLQELELLINKIEDYKNKFYQHITGNNSIDFSQIN